MIVILPKGGLINRLLWLLQAKLMNESAQTMADTLCDPYGLSQVLSMPDESAFSLADISRAICNQDVLNTARMLLNMSLPMTEIEKVRRRFLK